MAKKINCWEFHKCGRRPGGQKVQELGECPVCHEIRLEGVHDGEKAGRSCWAVAGTFCGGKVQGEFAAKFGKCQDCDFYKLVHEEEGKNFKFSSEIIKKLNK